MYQGVLTKKKKAFYTIILFKKIKNLQEICRLQCTSVGE